MLKFVRDTIERLAETSPLVPDCIIQEFHVRFDKDYVEVSEPVAIPDRANGLRHIAVCQVEGSSGPEGSESSGTSGSQVVIRVTQ
jgi:hypothetical protein